MKKKVPYPAPTLSSSSSGPPPPPADNTPYIYRVFPTITLPYSLAIFLLFFSRFPLPITTLRSRFLVFLKSLLWYSAPGPLSDHLASMLVPGPSLLWRGELRGDGV